MLVALLCVGTLGCEIGADDDAVPGTDLDVPVVRRDPPVLAEILTADRGPAPDELRVEDLAAGDGEPARAGSRVTAHVLVATWSDARVVDSSWERGQPLRVRLGEGTVIEALERGLPGMRVGGRRLVVAPPILAYEDRGVGELIGPDETLVLVVDLLAVDQPRLRVPLPDNP